MKVAICFSGSIRDFSSCYPSIKRYLLDNLNGDVFLHLWKMNDLTAIGTDTNKRFKWRNDSCNEDYVIQKLNPVRYQIDSYDESWEKKIISESGVDISRLSGDLIKYGINGTCMYYKIMMANQMAIDYASENNFHYDVIIRARLDFIWEDHITLDDFKDINDQTIFLIKDRYASHSGLATNDKFFAGSEIAMQTMSNLFHNIKTYQNMGLKVEGQTLNEFHIKNCNLNVRWIGHSQTYYKCMGRHAIKINRCNIYINNNKELDRLWFELAYYLMYQNYFVYYLNPDEKYHDLLSCFPNFSYYDGSPVNKIICTIGFEYYERFGGNQIVINNPTDKMCTNIQINQSIGIADLIDFVYSLIKTGNYKSSYSFTDKKIINDIVPNDPLIIKYLDHGYYPATFIGLNKGKFSVQVTNKKINCSRERLKIFNLIKYHNTSEPHLMPCNLHPNDTPVMN